MSGPLPCRWVGIWTTAVAPSLLPQNTATSRAIQLLSAPWDWVGAAHHHTLVCFLLGGLTVSPETRPSIHGCVRLFFPGPASGKPNLRLPDETTGFLLQKKRHTATPPLTASPHHQGLLSLLHLSRGFVFPFGLCRAQRVENTDSLWKEACG